MNANLEWSGCQYNCRDGSAQCSGTTYTASCSGTCYWSGATSYCGNNDTTQTICQGCGELWIDSECCGDDGTEDYASSDGNPYCCNAASAADDTWCDATWGWQIDGVQRQTDVYDSDGTWTPPTADDDLVANCNTGAYPCANGYADTAVDGVCAHTTTTGNDCDADDVAYNTTMYVSCNSRSDGYRCDTVTSGGSWGQDSMCLSDTNNGGSWDCKTDGTADHACNDGTYYEDTCASCSESNDCDSTLTSGDFSAEGDCFNNDGSMICCSGTNDYEDSAASNCCYNGAVMTDNTSSSSVLCNAGQFYDCVGQVTTSPDADTESSYCASQNGNVCGYANTWQNNVLGAKCCPIVNGNPNDDANCPLVNSKEWDAGSAINQCAQNKWLIQDTDSSGGVDDIWGVWTQNNTYGFYVLLNVSSGDPADNIRIYVDTDESGSECYFNATGIYDSTDDTPCTGHPAGVYASAATGYAEYRADLDYVCGTCCGGGGSCPRYLYLYVQDPDADNDRAPDAGYAEYDFSCGSGGPSAPIPELPLGAITAFIILLIMVFLVAPKSL